MSRTWTEGKLVGSWDWGLGEEISRNSQEIGVSGGCDENVLESVVPVSNPVKPTDTA